MRVPRVAALSVLAVALSVTSASDAPASPTLRDRGTGTGALADGDRWLVVAYPGRLTATDTLTAARRSMPLNAGCEMRDVHRGLLLVVCQTPTPGTTLGGPNTVYGQPFVIRLRTGRVASVPNGILSSGDNFGGPDPGWTGVGTQWLAGYLGCYHCEGTTQYVNWHTGERRSAGSFLDADPVGLDLDDPGLRPVTRRGRPNTIAYPRLDPHTGALTITANRRTTVLSRCRSGCGQVRVGADRYAWLEGRTIHGYVPRTNRRTTWKLPPTSETSIRVPLITRNRITAVADQVTTDNRIAASFIFTGAWPG